MSRLIWYTLTVRYRACGINMPHETEATFETAEEARADATICRSMPEYAGHTITCETRVELESYGVRSLTEIGDGGST